MGELGDLLRRSREDEGLSLAQAEEATRIRREFLQALEDEEFARLPAPVYVKGFLRNYATYLGLDPQQVLALYAGPGSEIEPMAPPAMLDEPLEPLSLRRFWPVSLVVLAIAILVIGWWAYQQRYGTTPFARATATPTSTLTATSAPPTPTSPPPTITPSPTRTATPTVAPTPVGLELSIEIVERRSWILVLADGFVTMYIGWEGVGLCSYLLIGYWFEREAAADAGKKAFIVNRVGDFGFFLAHLPNSNKINVPAAAFYQYFLFRLLPKPLLLFYRLPDIRVRRLHSRCISQYQHRAVAGEPESRC